MVKYPHLPSDDSSAVCWHCGGSGQCRCWTCANHGRPGPCMPCAFRAGKVVDQTNSVIRPGWLGGGVRVRVGPRKWR
jgi:hypothetical protein